MSDANVPAEASKRCAKCGQVKNFSEFYNSKGGKHSKKGRCKPCYAEDERAATARRRAEMGEEAWQARIERYEAKSRNSPERVAYRQAYEAARYQAVKVLVARNKAEFDALRKPANGERRLKSWQASTGELRRRHPKQWAVLFALAKRGELHTLEGDQ